MNDALAGYLAGFFDGEGTVYAATRWGRCEGRDNRPSPTIFVCMTNTNKEVMEFHQELFTGSLNRRPGNDRRRDQWQWHLCSTKAEPYLKAIFPHLIVKKAVVTVALQYIALMKTPRKDRCDYTNMVIGAGDRLRVAPIVRPEFRQRVLVLHGKIRELNKRGAPFNTLRERNVWEQQADNALVP